MTFSLPFELRVGNGFDIHRTGGDATMVLGGCEFPGVPSLIGHSDGDAIAHAIADALLGAAGLGDLGSWFPDTDPEFAGADSIELLARVAAGVGEHGWQVLNADCSVICETPKLAPQRSAMEARLGAAVRAPVSVKGRRPESVGALGRGEAIVCFASVLVARAAAAATTAATDTGAGNDDTVVNDIGNADRGSDAAGDDQRSTQ